MSRLCVTCIHFDIAAREPDWSEFTPGDAEKIYCTEGFWFMFNCDGTAAFRANIAKAITCDKFVDAAERKS